MSLGINNNPNIQYPYNQQTQQQKDNFGAISPQAQANLQKMGTAAKDTAKDSWLGNIMKGFGIEDPKKAIISAIGAVGVVFGLSFAMNKAVKSGSLLKLGETIDNFAKNNKLIKKISKAFSDKIGKPLKRFSKRSKLKKDLSQLKDHMMKPVNSMVKPMLTGTRGEALDSCTDTLKFFLKDNDEVVGALKKLTQKDDAKEILDVISKTKDKKLLDNLKYLTGKTDIKDITASVKDTLDNKKLKTLFSELTGSGDGFSDFVDSIRKISTDDSAKYKEFSKFYEKISANFTKNGKVDIKELNKAFAKMSDDPNYSIKVKGWLGKSNFGEAMKKYAILNGDAAETQIAKKTQQILLRGAEAMSNGVTSRNLMGLIMGLGIYNGVMNKTQEAPKGEKVSTFAEEAVGDMGNYMLFPVAGSLLYGASTLKYFGSSSSQIKTYKEGLKKLAEDIASGAVSKADGKTQYKALKQGLNKGVSGIKKPIRKLANILSTGLEVNPTNNKFVKKLKGVGGGAMRFALVMFAISPLLIKPVMKVCHKIFGKPTNTNYPDKADKARQQQEEMMKQIESMTPDQQYQMLLQLSQTPQIANDPQQKAYIDQMLAVLQMQMQQQPITPQQQMPGIQQPQMTTAPNVSQQPSVASQPISPSMQQQQSIDAGRSYIPSDEPAPGLVRKDLQR